MEIRKVCDFFQRNVTFPSTPVSDVSNDQSLYQSNMIQIKFLLFTVHKTSDNLLTHYSYEILGIIGDREVIRKNSCALQLHLQLKRRRKQSSQIAELIEILERPHIQVCHYHRVSLWLLLSQPCHFHYYRHFGIQIAIMMLIDIFFSIRD